MSNQLFRKYIDIINENSQALSSAEMRSLESLPYDLGRWRKFDLASMYPAFTKIENYEKNPNGLKNALASLSKELTALLEPWNRKPILPGNMNEYRIINSYEQVLMGDLSDLYKLVDEKNIEEISRVFKGVDSSVAELTKAVYKTLGQGDRQVDLMIGRYK